MLGQELPLAAVGCSRQALRVARNGLLSRCSGYRGSSAAIPNPMPAYQLPRSCSGEDNLRLFILPPSLSASLSFSL